MQTEILPLKEDRANPGQGPTSPEKENKSPRKSSAKGHIALAKSMPAKHKAPAEDDSNPKQSQRSPIQDNQDTNIRKTVIVKKERKKQTEKAAAEDFLKGISFGDPKKELPKKVKKPTVPVQPLHQSSQIERETIIPSTTPLATSLGQSFVSAPAPDELIVEERPMPVIEEVHHDDEEQQAKKKSSTKKKLVIKGANLKKYKSKLVNSTMYFTSSHQSYPIVSSLIVTSDAKLATPARTTSFERPSFSRERSSTIEDNTRPQLKTSAAVVKKPSKGTAYGYLLPQHDEYNPHFLDNSFVLPNKQRMVINLPGFRESFFPFVKASHLEEELDSEFKEKHPWLKTNLALNDIRKMKRRLFDVSLSVSLDVSTTALSYVYFERLIVKNLITKNNMKSYAAACLLLAAKFNNPREFAKRVFEAIDRTFVPARDVTSVEFIVYKDLAFKLMADMSDVEPHLQQLQASQDYQDHLFEYQARRRKGSARDSIYGELPNTGKQAANSQ